jgi:hypothetical protein
MSNFLEAIVEQNRRLRLALVTIRDVPGIDVERLRQIARRALEDAGEDARVLEIKGERWLSR